MPQNLKSYINRAKDLEVALYTQRRLMSLYQTTADKNAPIAPKPEKIIAPKKPDAPKKPKNYSANIPNLAFWFSGVFFMGLFAILCPREITVLRFIPAIFIIIILLIVFIFGSVFCILDEIKRKELFRLERKQYAIDFSKYSDQYDKYIIEYKKYLEYKKQVEKRFDKAMAEYKTLLSAYNENRKHIIEKHQELYDGLTASLQEHYSQNLLQPQYQNLIAVTSIFDYLQNGRCDTLDAACDLYETNLRQNSIIGLLPLVIENLEKIKDNQPTLYLELAKSNATVDEIIYDLTTSKSDAKLLTYFTDISAILK